MALKLTVEIGGSDEDASIIDDHQFAATVSAEDDGTADDPPMNVHELGDNVIELFLLGAVPLFALERRARQEGVLANCKGVRSHTK